MAKSDREGGGGLSLRTLVVASAASVTAAMVTSRLFAPGTIYVSALTPVIVAAVSEFLHRPVDRVTQLREQRRTMVLEAHRLETARVHGDEPSALRGAPDFALGDDAPTGNGTAGRAPVRVHGRRRGMRRVLHPKVWVVTGAVAFTIAAAALTLPELIFGGAVATKHRTTLFGGGGSSSTVKEETTTEPATTDEQAPETVTETVPAQTPPTTETTPAESGAETAPSGGAPAPSGTTTSTTTAPGGTAVPPLP